jgi:serine/threonine-protein kinase
MVQRQISPRNIVDISHYRFLRKIADGGMGSVYETVLSGANGFEKTVVIKMLHERYSKDRDFVDLFIGEAKLVANLIHQNIVQIYQLGKIKDTYYIAMEYVKGVNLAEFMNRHLELKTKVPTDLGAFIISRICRGLEYAHNKRDRDGNLLGVVHRDVSPKNIMISVEGEVRITDFGIAKARNLMKDLEGDVLMGKMQYMSPEQADFKTTDHRSDLFSLGIVMYELLTGVNLFIDSDTTVILKNVMSKKIHSPCTYNPDIPQELERIMLKALTRDITKRYQSASEMGYDLEYFMYHKGYGPTIITLEKYMRRLFPHLYLDTPEEGKRERRDYQGPTVILEREGGDKDGKEEGQSKGKGKT